MNKCAARTPLFAYFRHPKSYCSSQNHIIAPSRTFTMACCAPGPPGFHCCSDSGGDAPLGKSHCQQLRISISFLQLPLWDNTTSDLSLLGIHPLPSCAVHRTKKPQNQNPESQPQQFLLTPFTSSDATREQSGGGKPSFALGKSPVGPCRGRFVCMLLALACLCMLVLHSRGKLASREPCGKLAAPFLALIKRCLSPSRRALLLQPLFCSAKVN